MKNHSTKILVLRKIPFSETSLVINSISPDFGRIDLMVKGAKRLGKNKFPQIDLFNEVAVEFRESRSGTLNTLISSELIQSHISIAEFPGNLPVALNIAKFILSNTQFNMHIPITYNAFAKMLSQMSAAETTTHWQIFTRLIYLKEQGFLPDYNQNSSFAKILSQLISFVNGNSENIPKLDKNYAEKLKQWLIQICSIHHLEHCLE